MIRSVAIVLVVLVHVTSFPFSVQGEATAATAFDWWTTNVYGAVANLSVPLFVMLSGVLLLNPEKTDEPLRVFLKKRLARVGLPIIFWTIAYFAWNYYLHGFQLTPTNIIQGLIGGSYYHLWFLYLLVGLYLATPVLRIVVKYLDRQKFKFFLSVWVVGTFSVPFINGFGVFGYNPVMFVFVGWIGYFVLGTFLLKSNVSRRTLYVCLALGLAWTVAMDGLLPAVTGGKFMGFFHEPLNFSLVLASTALFLLLTAIPANKIEGHPKVNRALHWVSINTLPLYLLHVMVMEVLQNGWLGLSINMDVLAPIIEVPLLTVVTFALTVLIVYPLKKIPYVNKLIG